MNNLIKNLNQLNAQTINNMHLKAPDMLKLCATLKGVTRLAIKKGYIVSDVIPHEHIKENSKGMIVSYSANIKLKKLAI